MSYEQSENELRDGYFIKLDSPHYLLFSAIHQSNGQLIKAYMKLIEDLDTFQPIVPTTLSQEIRYHVFALSLLPPIGGLGMENISSSKLKFHHD
jgi:hypothetical protein